MFPDIGAAYKVYRHPRTWGQGKKYCNGEGANLAVIDSLQKVQYVKDLKGSDQFDIHVGIHRFFDENEWDEIRTGKILTRFKKTISDCFDLRLILFLI